MQQFSYPTTIYYGENALAALADAVRRRGHRRTLLVTDAGLTKLGLVDQAKQTLAASGTEFVVFDTVHPNPVEDDVEQGVAAYRDNGCDSIVALGGGSPMDAAKVVKMAVAHPGPLAQYDDMLGGDKLVVNPMPPLYAIPTTAGTGSEVGRSGVIIMRDTGRKTIFFAPTLMPDIAVLDPAVTLGLPPHITAATGVDALTHCVEAYFAPGFNPMADGIALQGIQLVLENLPTAVRNGSDRDARAKMLMTAAMGATAFQKGLGMVHSLAHPLSSQFKMHHGLANALLLPASIDFLQSRELGEGQRARIATVATLFRDAGYGQATLADAARSCFHDLGIAPGLAAHGIPKDAVEALTDEAIDDPCHATNMIPVTREDLCATYHNAM